MESAKMKRLSRNNKGVSPVLSSVIIVGITIACMLVAQQFAQNGIMSSHDKMGEKLCIERVCIGNPTIQVYVRNIGHADLLIQFAKVNGKIYNLTEGRVVLPQASEGQFVTIENYDTSPEDVYLIELVTANWNYFEAQVRYP
jgi:hypothetical protein